MPSKTPQIALDIINREKEERTGVLNLNNCGLTVWPEEIFEMEWLIEIDMSKNTIKSIPDLKSFSKLEKLFLSSNLITHHVKLNLPDSLKELSLAHNKLTEIPNIKGKNLVAFSLHDNTITQIKGLDNLPNLQILYLSKNEISKIEGLNNNHKIKSLYLHSNHIKFINGIYHLLNLKELRINDNKIYDLHHFDIERLPNLRVLYVYNNPIIHENLKRFSKTVNNFSALQSYLVSVPSVNKKINFEEANKTGILNLGNCGIVEWPEELFKLIWLEVLIMGDNTDWIPEEKKFEQRFVLSFKDRNFINDIPEKVSNLQNLKYFSIGGDYERRYPIKSLGGLKKCKRLIALDLSFCSFIDFYEFSILPNLTHLDLSVNQISTFANLLKNQNLKHLNLSENKIDVFENEEEFKILLEQLDYINLKNNPINLGWLNPVILEASGDDKVEILKLLILSLKGQLNKVTTLPQKVILLGNSEVGKTELAKVLIKDNSQFPDKGTTHGLKIRKWELGKKFNNKSVFIYDFGGQDFYHSVYNMFFTYDTVYIIVWDDKWLENQTYESKQSNDTFVKYNPEYWIQNIQYFLDRDKIKNTNQQIEIISFHNNFKNKINYQHLTTDISGLNHHFSLNLKGKNSTIKKLKIELLKESINEISSQFDDKFSLSAKDIDIFNHILKVFNEAKYKKYTIAEFYKEFGTPDYTSFLKVLHQKGIVFYLPEHPTLKDSVWINPSTISERIYKILDKASLLDSGELKEKDFDIHFNQDSDLKTLLIYQEVLFIDDSEERIIIPQYLPMVSDDDFLLDLASEGMETLFAIRFKDFMPHGLMSRLMCRLGKNPGRKILKRNEIICRLCISSPKEKIETVKIKVSCDMINLKLHIQLSKNLPQRTSKLDLQKYLFKVVLAAYWNENHLEFYEKPRSTGDGSGLRTTIDPLWIDKFLYKYASFEFEISTDFDIWVNYKQELFAANTPDDTKINPVINGKKYYPEKVYLDDYIDKDIIHYKNPSTAITSRENKDIITGYVEESFDKVQIKASLFNAFIVEQVKSPKKVFVSYAHADTEHRQTLQKYLINLQRENLIEIWHDGLINPGDDWDEKIIDSIEEADIVILLVSQSFIASAYIYNTEMPKALEKVLNKKGVIFPFILENCDWKKWNILMHFEAKEKSINVGKYQAMPVHPGQGIMQPLESKVWANSSDAWMVLVQKMRELCV